MSAPAEKPRLVVKHLHWAKRRVNGVWACAQEDCDVTFDKHGKAIEPPVRGHLRLVKG